MNEAEKDEKDIQELIRLLQEEYQMIVQVCYADPLAKVMAGRHGDFTVRWDEINMGWYWSSNWRTVGPFATSQEAYRHRMELVDTFLREELGL